MADMHPWNQTAQNVASNLRTQAQAIAATIRGGGPGPGAAAMSNAQEAEYYRATLEGNGPETTEALTARIGEVKVAQLQKQLGVNAAVNAASPQVPLAAPGSPPMIGG